MQKRLSERLGRIVKARLWNPILFLALVASVSCRAQVEIEDISAPPEVAAEDKKYANVFQSLDGTWAGKFYIYVDERGQTGDRPQPRNLEESILQRLPLKLEDEIHVRQTYVSESPYFQRAKITDTYLNDQDTLKVVESYGANKVQNGKLWCVVVKPDETVAHSGSVQGDHTIIWQRTIQEPLKIEYFKETVFKDSYTIVGWGYYGEDNPNLSPGYWFHGEYHRVE